MSFKAIRNAVEMTPHPKLSQLLALLIEHGSLTASEAAPLLDLPPFVVLRFANRLVCLGYATRALGNDDRYLATIAGMRDRRSHAGTFSMSWLAFDVATGGLLLGLIGLRSPGTAVPR